MPGISPGLSHSKQGCLCGTSQFELSYFLFFVLDSLSCKSFCPILQFLERILSALWRVSKVHLYHLNCLLWSFFFFLTHVASGNNRTQPYSWSSVGEDSQGAEEKSRNQSDHVGAVHSLLSSSRSTELLNRLHPPPAFALLPAASATLTPVLSLQIQQGRKVQKKSHNALLEERPND